MALTTSIPGIQQLERILHGRKQSAEEYTQREGCVKVARGGPNHVGLRETLKVSNALKNICSYAVELKWPKKGQRSKAGGFAAWDLASKEDGKVEVSC